MSTIIWLLLVNLGIKAIFIFGIDMQVQIRTGLPAYGLYFTLLNLCYIFQIINDFGLNLLHNTDTAIHGRVRRERWVQIFRLKLIMALVYSLIVMLIAWSLGYTDAWRLLIWLIINNILVSMIMAFRAGISGIGKFNLDGLLSVMDKALMILICGALLLSTDVFKIEWFVYAQTVSLLITMLFAFIISRKHTKSLSETETRPPLEVIFKESLPFTLATLLMFVYTRSDSILIEKLLPEGASHVGIYAAGFRLLDAANMLAFVFSPLLIPMYARLTKDTDGIRHLIRTSSGLMIMMTSGIAMAGYWWAEEIMHLLYPDAQEVWILTFRLLILCHIPIGLMYIYSSYLTAMLQMKQQNLLFVISVIINVGINIYMIPRMGTIGAAATALLTQSLTTAGLIYLGHKHMKKGIEISRIIRVFAFFIITAGGGYGLSLLTIHWTYEVTIFLTLTLIAGSVLNLLNMQSLRKIFWERSQLKNS